METSNITLRRLKTFLKSLENKFALKNHSHTTVNGHTVNTDVPSGAKFTDTNTWRPLGTTADTACAGNDSRLSNARPANGGTSDYTKKLQTYKEGSTTETYGAQYPLYAQWEGSQVRMKCDNYTVKTDYSTSAGTATNATKVNNHTVSSDVPANAKFTDTTYSDATTSAHGLMSPADKTKLNKIGSNVSIGSRITIASGTSISGVANNLTTTGVNFVLDARQGKALNDAITSLKKSVSDGKSAIASAITNAGVSTASDASFAIMVENIGNIFYKRLGKQLSKYYYANVFATSGSNGSQNIYRNIGTTTTGNWIGHETFFGGALTDLNGCIIITWLKGITAITIMRHKSAWLGTDNFETLYDLNLRYGHPDGGTITLHSSAITPGVEICTLCLACHS